MVFDSRDLKIYVPILIPVPSWRSGFLGIVALVVGAQAPGPAPTSQDEKTAW